MAEKMEIDSISNQDNFEVIKNCLEQFLNKEDEQLTRTSNGSYKMHNQKFMIRRQKKESMQQYSSLYKNRLEKLRPSVKEAASMKWIKKDQKINSPNSKMLNIVDNILEIKPFQETIIIGTLFKEQKLKPSILNNIMGILGQNKFDDDQQMIGGQVDQEGKDVAVLEDISGRISIQNSKNFDINEYVSGTIVALKGQAIEGGYFKVDEYCFAGIPFNSQIPQGLKIGNNRDLYDEQAIQKNSGRQFVCFLSGLQFGQQKINNTHVDLILKFFKGELGGSHQTQDGCIQDTRQLAAQIQRVIIAGDSIVQPDQVDEVFRGSYRTNKINQQVYSDFSKVIDQFEQFLIRLGETIDVDVMPGQQDFTNSFLPQQPLNSCLFPNLYKAQIQSINFVSNPHQFEMNGLNFLGTSGQNIKDIMVNSKKHENESIGETCIKKIKQTLEIRHLCPTAPDTLRIHPFKDSDPFVIVTQDDLDLNDECFNESQFDKKEEQFNSEVPHVYFAGNMHEYKEELFWNHQGNQQNNQFMKILSIPSFEKTQSIVLLDLQTLQSFEIKFQASLDSLNEQN